MKKSICGFMVLAFAVTVLFTGCLFGLGLNVYPSYDGAGNYTSGDAYLSGDLNEIEIDWVEGSVNIVPSDDGKIKVVEISNMGLDDVMKVHYYFDTSAKKLSIKYCASGAAYYQAISKSVVVFVPATLDTVTVRTVSASVNVTKVAVKNCKVSTVSGGIDLAFNGKTENLKVESVSGSITAVAGDGFETVVAKSVSGGIGLSAGKINNFDLESTSGSMVLTSTVAAPEKGKFETVSGSVHFGIPENEGYVISYKTISGSVKSDFDDTFDGKNIKYKNGKNSYGFESTSGSLTVQKL